jgi:hypothetical protein
MTGLGVMRSNFSKIGGGLADAELESVAHPAVLGVLENRRIQQR